MLTSLNRIVRETVPIDYMAEAIVSESIIRLADTYTELADQRPRAIIKLDDLFKSIVGAAVNDHGIPLLERAAYTSALHSSLSNQEGVILSLDDFEARAIRAHAYLSETDAQLRTPGTPVLAFETRSGSRGIELGAHAAGRARGDGLRLFQIGARSISHCVTIPETRQNEHLGSHMIVDCMSTSDFISSLVPPQEAGVAIEWAALKQNSTCILIGDSAVQSFFESAQEQPNAGVANHLLDAAAQAGIAYPLAG
jgi:hypothetical protein